MSEQQRLPSDPPYYFERHVFGCTNQRPPDHPEGCCHSKGAEPLVDHLRDKVKELEVAGVRVNRTGCLGRCELGPAFVVYPEGVWYRPRTTADIDEIIQAHLVEGGRVERLMLGPEGPIAA
jgi:(2Fe-2S) ferredoxin